jgi:hypothetical protein
VTDPIRQYELAKSRLSFAVAILHICDLDGLARIHAQLTSPQALLDGFHLSTLQTAQDWLALINAAIAVRDLAPIDPQVLNAVEDRLPPELRRPGEEVAEDA